MTAVPAFVLLTAAVGLGLLMGLRYLRGVRNKPVLIGVHLLLGAGGIETTVVLLRGTPNGDASPAGTFGAVAAGLLAVAMFSGLTASLLGRPAPKAAHAVLWTHAGVGAAGFLLFLAWVATL